MKIPSFLRGLDQQAQKAGWVAKPVVVLPGRRVPINEAAAMLGDLLAVQQGIFARGGTVTRIRNDSTGVPSLEIVTPAALASEFENVAVLHQTAPNRNDPAATAPTVCSEQTAKLIAASTIFLESLPNLKVLAPCAVLAVSKDGKLREVTGYDPATGIFSKGAPTVPVTMEQAFRLVRGLLRDFKFATPGDEARAYAALVTPALVTGGLLGGRAPISAVEADLSQTGKGYWNKLVAAIYGSTVLAVAQRRGGVGSLEESFDRALIQGRAFISLDNMRGAVDSPRVEAFMTEDEYLARGLRCEAFIDPARVNVMMTSNRAELTKDLANRVSCVRLVKQPEGYVYEVFPEGDLLAHVRANQPLYLGAIHTIIRGWWARGRPRTNESRHDFRAWAQQLDWICQNLLDTCPIMDGHQEVQVRASTPALNWLRDIALAVRSANGMGKWYRTHDLIRLVEDDPAIELPGLGDGDSLDQDHVLKAVQQHVGRRMKQAFGDKDRLEVDTLLVEKRMVDVMRREAFGTYPAPEYRFSPLGTGTAGGSRTDAQLIRADANVDETQSRTDAADAYRKAY